jgi:P27 family predicted phage terminase small subunit
MPRGRPKKPDDLKILDGTWRRDRDGKPEERVQAEGEPVPPSHLKGESLSFWKHVVPGLIKSGVAKEADAPELAMMCEWWGRYRRYSRMLDRMKNNDKNLYQTTILCGIACTNFDKVASKFGLTPSDRAKLRVPNKPKEGGVMSRKRNA